MSNVQVSRVKECFKTRNPKRSFQLSTNYFLRDCIIYRSLVIATNVKNYPVLVISLFAFHTHEATLKLKTNQMVFQKMHNLIS